MVGADQGVAISDYSLTTGGIFGTTRSIFRTNSDNGNNSGLFRKNVTSINDGGGFTNANFGEEVPIAGGIAVLLAAGLGYVALKKKEDKQ